MGLWGELGGGAEARIVHKELVQALRARAETILLERAAKSGETFVTVGVYGRRGAVMELDRDLAQIGARLLHRGVRVEHGRSPRSHGRIYAGESAIVFSEPSHSVVLGRDGVELEQILAVLEAHYGPEEENESFYVLVKDCLDALTMQELPPIGRPLERENYTPDVLDAYDHALVSLGADSPPGRFVLIEGPPGTGKTHLLRGLAHDLRGRAKMTLLPARLVGSIDGPELLSVLLDEVDTESESKRSPVVIVIEDADECLLPRGQDNIAAISALLNLGDGILGDALDVRMVATTNAELERIDRALLRPGRLAEQIRVGELSIERVHRVARRIAPDLRCDIDRSMRLAEVYAWAREKERGRARAPI